MGFLKQLMIRVGADTSAVDKELKRSAKEVQQFGKSLERVGSTMTKAITLPILATGAAALKLGTEAMETEEKFKFAFGAVVATFVRETKPVSTTAPPKVPMLHRLFHPAARLPGMVFFCTGIGWTAIASFLSLYARDIGLSNSDILFVALSISVLATRFISGGLADRFGRLAVVVPSIVLVTAGLTGLAVFDTPTAAVISLAVFGVGYSGGFPALLTMVVDRAPERERGVAMSSFNVFFDIGAPIGGYGVGQLIDWGGFPMGFGFSALAAGIGLLFLPAMRRPTPAGVAGAT